MEIKDLKPNQGNVDLILTVVSKEELRTFEKFGKSGRVCSAKVKDGSGEVKLTLWNDEIEQVNAGDRIHLQKGWCSEYRDEKQVSAGKFGKIEILGKSTENPLAKEAKPIKKEQFFAEEDEEAENFAKDSEEELEE